MTLKAQMKAIADALDPKSKRAVVIAMGEAGLGDAGAVVRVALMAASTLSKAKLDRIAAQLATPTNGQ